MSIPMNENTPISSDHPTSWDQGCEQARRAWQALRRRTGQPERELTRLIQGLVTASFCHRVIFVEPGSAIAPEPKLQNGHADSRYLKAKSAAVERDSSQARQALLQALRGENLSRQDEAARALVTEVVGQTQASWFVRDPESVTNRLIRVTVRETVELLLKELHLDKA